MCGICGMAWDDPTRPAEVVELRRMASALVHRGPDSEGVHAAAGVGLGIRRLAIIDIAHGDQPIANEDGSVVVVCNGEIYNHVELRTRLVAAGHRFRTGSDVEVIVHLYEEHGADFVHHLRGMFAIALWDARAQALLLVRDRLGIKPLHYARTRDGIVFASEQKAILAIGAVEAEPDPQALRDVFSHTRVVGPRTMVKGILRLQAGHCLTFACGQVTITQWWDARFPARDAYERGVSAHAWAEGLRAKLDESVRLHLRSDVPVGAWLSAGIDSSAVTALAVAAGQRGMPTFTLRFEDPRFDELRTQRGLDDFPAYGLAGHRVLCSRADLDRLPQAIRHGEDMMLASIVVSQLVIAEASARSVKVVLTGEGSDEVLGGYSWYPTLRAMQPLFALPGVVRRAIAGWGPIERRWPGAASVLAGDAAMDFERYARSVTHLRAQAMGDAVLVPDLRADGRQSDDGIAIAPAPDGFATWHPFAQMQYWDLKHRLADAVVQGLDRASMAHSVEARVPFLDHEVVEFCARIPPAVKMRWLTEKAVLRAAMADVLPREIAQRKKFAMQAPGDDWMRGLLPGFAEELLSPQALQDAGYFDAAGVARLRAAHRAGTANHGKVLMGVLGLQIWDDIFRRQGRVCGVT
ncbi:MAG: asparagine synthase (glutamine-hydrolyzing) [Casimicrobiaceae bacterium]